MPARVTELSEDPQEAPGRPDPGADPLRKRQPEAIAGQEAAGVRLRAAVRETSLMGLADPQLPSSAARSDRTA